MRDRSQTSRIWLTAVGLAALVVCLVSASKTVSVAAAVDIYAFAGECMTLQDVRTDEYVSRNTLGYSLKAEPDATPFRMQATALGSYLLFGPDGEMPATGLSTRVVATEQPGPPADWRLVNGLGGLRLKSVASGRDLTAARDGSLEQATSTEPRWAFKPATGCAEFPEIEVNVDGTPPPGSSPTAEVRGFLDAHVHVTAFDFLGGRFHCGRPWSPYGVSVALVDCPDHGPNGQFAFVENLLKDGTLEGTHSPDGWPSFEGWPTYDSQTHEGTYWKGIERSWRAGLRIMVVDLVENRALCELYPLKQNPCTDMESMRLQAKDLHALQDYIDAQWKGPGKGFFRIVRSPAEARAVINQGKLAVVIGVETSQPFDCLYQKGEPLCSRRQIDRGLRELWSLGVRSLYPVHKFDNAFGGTAMDDHTAGILVNIGNKWMTGEWWTVEDCPGTDTDRTPDSLGPTSTATALRSISGKTDKTLYDNVVRAIFDGPLPTYPEGPVCNTKGLTELGEYLINRMIDMGMIIETDHMSVKARRQTLDIIEAREYSGVITSHSWGDLTSQARIQQVGGVVAFHVNNPAPTFVSYYEDAKADQPSSYYWGLGFGTDTNGLSVQAPPRNDGLAYPFVCFDGTTVSQSQWGEKTWDFRTEGAAHYGLYADWIENMRLLGGETFYNDLTRGAEAYLQMWQRATSH